MPAEEIVVAASIEVETVGSGQRALSWVFLGYPHGWQGTGTGAFPSKA